MSKRKLRSETNNEKRAAIEMENEKTYNSYIYHGHQSLLTQSQQEDDKDSEMVINDIDPLIARRPAELAALYRERDIRQREFNLRAIQSLKLKCTRNDNVQFPVMFNHRNIEQSKLCICDDSQCVEQRKIYDSFINAAANMFLKSDNDPCWK